MSPGHGARDGVRGASQGGLKDVARKSMRECEGGHCMPPILTPAKGYLEEKVNSGFGPSRKRLLSSKAEQDDTEREDGERLSHTEKRARISAGEDFSNMLRHPHATSILPQITREGAGLCFPFISLILPVLFPSSCVLLSPVSSLVLYKKSFYSFCRFLLPNQFHLKPVPSQPPLSPPIPLSVPSFALCGSQLREVFNPAFERSAREK